MRDRRPVRLAVDIGGTFTDLEFTDAASGRSGTFKSPTTPADPSLGLMAAITGAADRYGFALGDVSLLLHGTTIATNAVLTRDLPVGALVTTAGFEDVLAIGRHARRDVYGLRAEVRPVLVPRRRRFGIRERIGAGGAVLVPPSEAEIDRAVDAVLASGAEVAAVCLLNSFVDPRHEIAIRDRFRTRAPGIDVSCSHEISPEMREFERTSTTVLNALLMPVVRRYLASLETRRTASGFSAPLYLIQSNGGATVPADAAIGPARLLLSGPSGGVLAAERLAALLREPNVVAVDMGGTSYDVSLIHDGRRATVSHGEIDGLPVRLPMVEMRTIGAGGGSLVWLDGSGRLQVGPRSAGAQPGPVSYGRGGTEPTVTDANVVLGRLDPATFMGGEIELDREGARRAFAAIGARLGLGPEALAEGVLSIVVAKFAQAIKLSLFERGLDPADFALMSFGGAGGLHAAETAAELGMTRVIFPKDPSTFSAHGILRSDIVHDLASARILPLVPGAAATLRAMSGELREEGRRVLDRHGLGEADRSYGLSADLRYRGQAFELAVRVDDPEPDDAAVAALAGRFHDLHRRRFSFDDPGETVELVTLRLAAAGRLGGVAPGLLAPADPPGPARSRPVRLGGAVIGLPVFRQSAIGAGAAVEGPAMVEQDYTTLLLPAGWTLTAMPSGDLVARHDRAA